MERFTVEHVESIAILTLNAGKANAINPECLDALASAFQRAESDDVRGVVLTGYDRFFSGGLDLVMLYDYDRAQFQRVLDMFNQVFLRVFTFPKPVVAAINGHAIAGGCILALACDMRVMVEEDALIGLNEIRLGLCFPAVALEIARFSIPEQHLAQVLYVGKTYAPEQAKALGLVDALAPRDQLLKQAIELAKQYAEPSSRAYGAIKAALKEPFVRRAEATLAAGADRFLGFWFSPEAKQAVGRARAELLAKRRS
jgi:enoyl-CoA hydratase